LGVKIPPQGVTIAGEPGALAEQQRLEGLERVKEIEPSYSAWTSPDSRNVFKSRRGAASILSRPRQFGVYDRREHGSDGEG
jgi:hypothetical protein